MLHIQLPCNILTENQKSVIFFIAVFLVSGLISSHVILATEMGKLKALSE